MMALVLWLSIVTPAEVEILRHYDFDRTVVSDILWIAEQVDVDPLAVASLVASESMGKRGAVRYCADWKDSRDRAKGCSWQMRCERGCYQDQEVWPNRLSIGLFQLQHSPTWSWYRWYERHTGEMIREDCGLERFCVRDVVVEVIYYMQRSTAATKKRRCKRAGPAEFDWMMSWNGCGSYRRHVRRVMRQRGDR
jgi:hypothetical protein